MAEGILGPQNARFAPRSWVREWVKVRDELTMPSRARILGALLLLIAAVAVACAPGYVMRAAYEEAKFLWKRKPIERVLRASALHPSRRDKLELVLRVRRFARERVGLAVDGSYSSVSEVDGSALVHVLSAARRDRLERYTWWFPVVGRVPYKGFFSKKSALAAAERLAKEGYDTYVRPSIAFSTLGWFDDPLPSSLLERDRVTLADVVFHELFHATVFVPGEMAFNESAANFVGHRAAIDFFCFGSAAIADDCDEAHRDWEDTLRMSRLLDGAVDELKAFYATKPKGGELDSGRERIFDEIRARFQELGFQGVRYSRFPKSPLNNATLLHDRIYLRDLDSFEQLYRREGGLRRAVKALAKIAEGGGDPFSALRRRLRSAPVDMASRTEPRRVNAVR